MGIISEKQVTLDNGLTVTTNVYSSYGSSSITMSKGIDPEGNNVYSFSGTLTSWINHEAKRNSKNPISTVSTSHSSNILPEENLFRFMYSNYTKDITLPYINDEQPDIIINAPIEETSNVVVEEETSNVVVEEESSNVVVEEETSNVVVE
jgi:hypothetical protein